jgi:hypothetical protein
MNIHERFRKTMQYGHPDRIPYFENEIRREVINRWCKEGLGSATELRRLYPTDAYTEIEPDLYPSHPIPEESAGPAMLKKLKKRLNFDSALRLPLNWIKLKKQLSANQEIQILVVHQGLFLSLGVESWRGFDRLMDRIRDQRNFIISWMEIYGDFAAKLADKILSAVKVDAALFNEPIGGLNGPLLSPAMYKELALDNYQPVLRILARHGVPVTIFRTYANARLLLPQVLAAGFNCLWAYETNCREMEYPELRREFGRDLRLIGGIDTDALRQDRDAIRREIEEKVPALLADGGYIPTADGRIREDVSFQNYQYYRKLMQKYIRI